MLQYYNYYKTVELSRTALCPLHPEYCSPYPRWETISRDDPSQIVACSVWNMNWQHTAPASAFSVDREWLTEWMSDWARVPASSPVCSCWPDSAPPSLTEPHLQQLQLLSITSIPKIHGQVFLMETVTWNDFLGHKLNTQYTWSFILHWDPMYWG